MDAEHWMTNPAYADGKSRSANRDALNAEIEAMTSTRTSAELIESMVASGVPCGEINNIQQAFENPQVEHLGVAQSVESPALGDINLIGQPFALERTPSSIAVAPPERGEHTDEILLEMGFSSEELTEMRDAQVI